MDDRFQRAFRIWESDKRNKAKERKSDELWSAAVHAQNNAFLTDDEEEYYSKHRNRYPLPANIEAAFRDNPRRKVARRNPSKHKSRRGRKRHYRDGYSEVHPRPMTQADWDDIAKLRKAAGVRTFTRTWVDGKPVDFYDNPRRRRSRRSRK